MTLTQAIFGFAALSAVPTLIPGLDTTLVLRAALTAGRRRATATGLGISAGLLLWGCAAALGAAALLAASELAYRIVTYAGAAYMIYLGVGLILRSLRRQPVVETAIAVAPKSCWRRSFGTGLTTNLLNPKIGVFYIATIPQFIPAGASTLGVGLLLASMHVAMTVCWFALLITGAQAARRWLAHARAIQIIDRIAGTAMIGLGAKLALQHR